MGPDQTRRQGEPESGVDAAARTPRPALVTLSQAVAAIQESLSTAVGQHESVTVDIGVELLAQAPNGAPLPQLTAFVAPPGEAVATVRIELKTRQSFAFPPYQQQPFTRATAHTDEPGDPFNPTPFAGPLPVPPSDGVWNPVPIANPNPPNSQGFPNVTSPGPSAGGEDDEF